MLAGAIQALRKTREENRAYVTEQGPEIRFLA
jgi:hypothetical protein